MSGGAVEQRLDKASRRQILPEGFGLLYDVPAPEKLVLHIATGVRMRSAGFRMQSDSGRTSDAAGFGQYFRCGRISDEARCHLDFVGGQTWDPSIFRPHLGCGWISHAAGLQPDFRFYQGLV